MNIASTHELIVTVQLCIGLFKEHNPELVAMALSKKGLSIGIAGDVVIDCNSRPLSILAEPKLVDAC
jgi:hypothetical protein